MIAELREKGQITIPQKLLKKLELKAGDKFEVVEVDGELHLVPVVVYPKRFMDQLEIALHEAEADYKAGKLKAYDSVDELFADLDGKNDL